MKPDDAEKTRSRINSENPDLPAPTVVSGVVIVVVVTVLTPGGYFALQNALTVASEAKGASNA